MPTSRGFVSDNCSGVHPELLAAIEAANEGHVPSYGSDRVTHRFEELVTAEFGPDAVGFPVLNGTGANVTALRSVTRPHQGVICTETAHIHVDETASPEAIAGVKLLTVSTEDGKLTPQLVSGRMPEALDIPHVAWPSVVSVTQATEVGTAYSPDEIRALSELAHDNNMLLHMDGARLANAAAAADLSLSEASIGSGVDVLTFGATKNGAMYGEAVIFADHDLAKDFEVWRKGSLQLGSKTRFISAQLEALLTNGLWRDLADNANRCARALADAIEWIDGVEVVQEVQANIVFILMKLDHAHDFLDRRRPQVPLLFPMGDHGLIRLVASWNSEMDDVDRLVSDLTAATGAHVH